MTDDHNASAAKASGSLDAFFTMVRRMNTIAGVISNWFGAAVAISTAGTIVIGLSVVYLLPNIRMILTNLLSLVLVIWVLMLFRPNISPKRLAYLTVAVAALSIIVPLAVWQLASATASYWNEPTLEYAGRMFAWFNILGYSILIIIVTPYQLAYRVVGTHIIELMKALQSQSGLQLEHVTMSKENMDGVYRLFDKAATSLQLHGDLIRRIEKHLGLPAAESTDKAEA